MIGRRRFWRDRQGRYHPALEEPERALLCAMAREAQHVVEKRDPSADRVFPTAYPDDDKAERDYRELMGESLLQRHQRALSSLASGCESASIEADELHEWLGALEVLRLVVGTQLGVSEDMASLDKMDPNDPKTQQLNVYQYLSVLQSEIVDVLAEALPVPSGESDDLTGNGGSAEEELSGDIGDMEGFGDFGGMGDLDVGDIGDIEGFGNIEGFHWGDDDSRGDESPEGDK